MVITVKITIMEASVRIKDQINVLRQKSKIVKSWDKRIKKAWGSRRQFCRIEKESNASLSRYINGAQIPSDKIVNRIEEKLKKAGV